jgi:polysaccharide chain length determinant protein (PEP-CTERM system associated)
MDETSQKTILDYWSIAKRRKWSLVLPAAAVFLLSAAIAFLMTPLYESTSTILIEEQEIPRDFVVSTVTGFAEQRIQSINQRIMSTPKLLSIIDRFNLYADLRDRRTTDEIVTRMREKDIKLKTIGADLFDRRIGNPLQATTIAFTLSYRGKQPAVVQQVANMLASLYLEENLRTREQRAEGASRFLEVELKEVKSRLAAIDSRITPFKTKYIQQLPEHLEINLQALERVERDTNRAKTDLRAAGEREDYLRTQLAHVPSDNNPNRILLKEMKAKLVELKSRSSDAYPDVIRLRSSIAELQAKLAAEPEKGANDENPAFVTIASQLASAQSEIGSLKRELEQLANAKEMYQHRIESTPGVEEEYKGLLQERNSMQLKYDDLMKKVLEAKVSQGLEKEQMGERFTLIDGARFPEMPVSPNIPVFLLIGLFLGIGTGIGAASLREMSDGSVRTTEELEELTRLPVLGGIPGIETIREKSLRRKRRWVLSVSSAGVLLAGMLAFHFLYMDLEIFWIKLVRRLMS